ncbi:MAG: leucyl aminopeptidase [Planctomycetes bacterium]|nr:leucyl aminopeptidase [Planctomycetota bacterium]
MKCRVVTSAWKDVEADWLVVGLPEEFDLSGAAGELDRALDGQLARLREAEDLTGKHAELLTVHGPRGIAARRLLLVGLGKLEELTAARLEKALLTSARKASEKEHQKVAVAWPSAPVASMAPAEAAALIATTLTVGCVGQDLYQSEHKRFLFDEASVAVEPGGDAAGMEEAVRRGQIVGEAMNLTRELVNRPAQDIYPHSFAQQAQALAEKYGLECEIFDQSRLEAERMDSLLAVARGSDQPPRMVVLRYRGGKGDAPTLALIGKGVTFDSGGLSLKPTDGMVFMKCDMAGAATVLGAMAAIARLGLPVNVAGYMGLVENMVSGRSYKLGDVLTARNGTTIEVLNTDAEGRLVLADVLCYAVDEGAAKLIDLATLTGACMVALGEEVTGCFSNDEAWQQAVLSAAKRVGEDVWPLPMFDHYAELLKSDVADCKNVGPRWGGAITAAKFLEKFVSKTPWVHLDIAGASFASSNKPHREGGATGCMVRTLVEIAGQFGPK